MNLSSKKVGVAIAAANVIGLGGISTANATVINVGTIPTDGTTLSFNGTTTSEATVDTYNFTIPSSLGADGALLTAQTFPGANDSFDTKIKLYPQGGSPLSDTIVSNDDGGGACGTGNCSLISDFPLLAGDYSLDVSSSFDPSTTFFGEYRLDLTATAAQIADVPEPATLATLALGLAGIGAMRRRRKA